MLQKYELDSNEDVTHALREVMQDIALAGLYRGGFFEKAAFYGGTCLRIFYGLPRFSEDLDFSLLKPMKDFSFEPFFSSLKEEFSAFGFEVEITQKQKTSSSDIASAFLKNNSSIYDLKVAGQKVLKIKFEVDTDPPLGFSTEEKLLVQPYSFYAKCFSLPDLYAGKMHALLFRKWKNRVKGRDWFDLEWYVRKGVSLNLSHLCERARQSGDWALPEMSPEQLQALLHERIESLDVNSARADVARFVRTPEQMDIWSREYFNSIAGLIRFL